MTPAARAAPSDAAANLVSARSAASPFPNYVRSYDGLWELYSNGHWNADRDKTNQIAQTGAPKDVPHGDLQWFVWTACDNGRQTVTFSRTVDLPGPPSHLMFHVYSRVRAQPATEGTAKLVVNGRSLYRGPVYAFSPSDIPLDSASQRRDFRFGVNRIQLVITKNAGVHCRLGAKHDEFGVAWKLEGESAADLGITSKSGTFYKKTTGALKLFASVPVRNFGPDAFLGAGFSVTLDYANNLRGRALLVKSFSARAPYEACTGWFDDKKTNSPPWFLQEGSTQCTAKAPFPPNSTSVIDFVVIASWENGVDPTYRNWGEYELLLSARSTGGFRDLNPDNDTVTVHVVLCGPKNNNPKCSKAE